MQIENRDLAVVILAAGRSSRMNSGKNKVFHCIGNLPIIMHVIISATTINPSKIVLVVSNEMLEQMQWMLNEYANVIRNAPLFEIILQSNPNGTAGAAMVGLSIAQEYSNIVIMYADTPLVKPESLEKMFNHLISSQGPVILAFKSKNTKGYGRLILNSDETVERIVEFIDEKDKITGMQLFNSGIMAFKRDTLLNLIKKINNNNKKGEYYLTDIVNIAHSNDVFFNYIVIEKSESIGVNSRIDLSLAEKIFQQNMRAKCMNNGITLLHPNSIFFSYDTVIGRDSVIYPNIYFGKNAILGKNVVVHPFCYISECHIEDSASIGPFASISNGSIISNGSCIGKFVEIKRSVVKDGAKVKHLSYLGDTEIGENSNIGAGTIFCNYNGKTKNRTKVGKRCFIGANNSIIAPIEIGDDSKTAAGSVIYNDVPERHTAITRCSQQNRAKKG